MAQDMSNHRQMMCPGLCCLSFVTRCVWPWWPFTVVVGLGCVGCVVTVVSSLVAATWHSLLGCEITWHFPHRPQPKPRPSLSRPKPTSTAQALVLEGLGRKKLSQAGTSLKVTWSKSTFSPCNILNIDQSYHDYYSYAYQNAPALLFKATIPHFRSFWVWMGLELLIVFRSPVPGPHKDWDWTWPGSIRTENF